MNGNRRAEWMRLGSIAGCGKELRRHHARRHRGLAAALACGVAVSLFPSLALPPPASASAHAVPVRITDQEPNPQALSNQGAFAISSDGRYVAYESDDPNIVDDDTNATSDVFLLDQASGVTSRVSVATGGAQADGWSFIASISHNGRYVAFRSVATNLGGGANGRQQVYVHDHVTGETTIASVSSTGALGDSDSVPAFVSNDGRYVVFGSSSKNLGGAPNTSALFVRDRSLNTTKFVADWATPLAISDDGTLVLAAMNGNAIWRWNVVSMTSQVVADSSTFGSFGSMSGDGRYVTWTSNRSDLVYFKDMVGSDPGPITLHGSQGLGRGHLSPNGRFMAILSVQGDWTDDENLPPYLPQIYLWDRNSDTMTLVSRNLDGRPTGEPNDWYAAVSNDGEVFFSTKSRLDDADSTQSYDVFAVVNCGDSTIAYGEGCDDGNDAAGDGCDARCQVEPCYTCSGTPSSCSPLADGAACDDRNSCTASTACDGGLCLGQDACLQALCPGGSDPCVVSTAVTLPARGWLDLGGRDLHVTGSGRILGDASIRQGEYLNYIGQRQYSDYTVGGAIALTNVGDLTVDAGGSIMTTPPISDTYSFSGDIGIEATGACRIEGTVSATATPSYTPNRVMFDCGSVELGPKAKLQGTLTSIDLAASAGPVVLPAGSTISLPLSATISLPNAVHASSSANCDVGSKLSALDIVFDCDGGINVAEKADISTGKSGRVGHLAFRSANGDVIIAEKTKLTNRGYEMRETPYVNTGIDISAGGRCSVGAKIDTSSEGGYGTWSDWSCDDGLTMTAKSKWSSKTVDWGTHVNLASAGSCDIGGKLQLKSSGGGSHFFGLDCGDGVTLGEKSQLGAAAYDIVAGAGPLIARGKIKPTAEGYVRLQGLGVTVEAPIKNPAWNNVFITSALPDGTIAGDISIAGNINVKPGFIELEGCDVSVQSGVKLNSYGTYVDDDGQKVAAGTNTLIAHRNLIIDGDIVGGTNDLRYRNAATIADPTAISPAKSPVQDLGLSSCP